MGLEHVVKLFRRRVAQAARRFPAVRDTQLVIDWSAGRTGRAYAFCESGRPPTIVLSPRLLDQRDARVEGVLRHEIGHAIDFAYTKSAIEDVLDVSLPTTSELRADAIASAVWREPIRYDRSAVQTIRRGTGRPKYLPQ